jgi:hypothetical protein
VGSGGFRAGVAFRSGDWTGVTLIMTGPGGSGGETARLTWARGRLLRPVT